MSSRHGGLVIAFAAVLALAGGLVYFVHNRPHRQGYWHESLEAALDQARQEHKVVLADFTGSDWCVACKRLTREVFATDDFARWANAHAVLLDVDFPQATELPPGARKRHDELARRFNVDELPTVVFLDASGAELGRAGYMEGGPTAWIAVADSIIARSGARPSTASVISAR